ncbi:hypothetical protein T492DRAFT_952398 [Pavlovales sp. CCMP2436]|nr:hypothetical protein T492DRAFT_952398 [Pavlovales sp. CCMP2436]
MEAVLAACSAAASVLGVAWVVAASAAAMEGSAGWWSDIYIVCVCVCMYAHF